MGAGGDIWKLKGELIDYVVSNSAMRSEKQGSNRYHYTSLEVLFSIMDNDSFWISNVRFSNDSSEERLFGGTSVLHDDYMICFCDHGDQLSQWRGYCHDGGASIKFHIYGPLQYSVLHTDYDTTHRYELYENAPLPVIYVEDTESELKECQDVINSRPEHLLPIQYEDMVPYLKNDKFKEEREIRMAFQNSKGRLSKCIRFRMLKNGVKIPYMVVKQGDIGRMFGSCGTDAKVYDERKLDEIVRRHESIWIEEGSNQESIYYEILGRVEDYAQKYPSKRKINVFCKGHLPIEQITVAPTYDRARIAEQIERFCMSKYWLRNVKVVQSKIPFIM